MKNDLLEIAELLDGHSMDKVGFTITSGASDQSSNCWALNVRAYAKVKEEKLEDNKLFIRLAERLLNEYGTGNGYRIIKAEEKEEGNFQLLIQSIEESADEENGSGEE